MKNNNPVILEFEHILKIFRIKTSLFKGDSREVIALNNVSFKIFKGEIFGLVGESGSGKTTIGRLITKLEHPDKGRLTFDGENIETLKRKSLRAFRRKVQMIFQDPYQSLNPYLSVYDTLSEPLIIHNVGDDKTTRKDKILRIMKSVGLSPPEDFLHRFPYQLSGGQRQRVAIARAMILEPSFVVADEPTSMLDAPISIQIFNILSQFSQKHSVTFLFITHSLAAARYLCDRIAVIYKGELVEMGPVDDIIQNHRHPYTRALIEAHPKFRYY
ncbi:MAG: ATP-binding cassette domain-containing protein [Desulfobacterales bacterium]|nr:ATP-binding cassette domain-containing protein [Desulfobacterales bacterium]